MMRSHEGPELYRSISCRSCIIYAPLPQCEAGMHVMWQLCSGGGEQCVCVCKEAYMEKYGAVRRAQQAGCVGIAT